MKKRTLAVLLILCMALTLLPTSVFAAANDHAIQIELVKDSTTIQGKTVLRVDFLYKSGSTDVPMNQMVYLKYDAAKLAPLKASDGSDLSGDLSARTDFSLNCASLLTANNYASTDPLGSTEAVGYARITGGYGYFCWKITEFGNTHPFSAFTRISSIFFDLKGGSTFTALPDDAIALGTTADSSITAQTLTAEVTYNGSTSIQYGLSTGTNALSAPEIVAGDGVTLALPAYHGAQATAPTVSTKVGGSVTLNANAAITGETVEYATATTADVPTAGWQDGVRFTGLAAGSHYFFARVKATDAHQAGAGAVSAAVQVFGAITLQYTAPTAMTCHTAITDVSPSISGGSASYSYAVTAGALPAGLSLDTASGTISGTPTTAGTAASVTITATDSEQATGACTIAFPAADKAANTIYGFTCADVVYGAAPAPNGATAVSGTPTYTYSASASGPYGEWNTANGVGTYYVKASVAESADYAAAEKVQNFRVTAKSLAGTNTTFSSVPVQTYSGSAIEPKPTVTVSGVTLAEGTDFTYSYSSNTYVGTASIMITGKGNYTGSTSTPFSISAAANPAVITSTAVVTRGGNTVDLSGHISRTDGTVSYSIQSGGGSITPAGIYTSPESSGSAVVLVTVAAYSVNNDDETPEYLGTSGSITVTITDKTAVPLTGGVTQTGCTYGQTPVSPVFSEPAGTTSTTITYSGTLLGGASYASSTSKPTGAGTYTVTVVCETATQICSATSLPFTIAPKDISNAMITLGPTLTYTGASQTQSVIGVMAGNMPLFPGSYTLSGNTGIRAGSYTLTVTAANANFTGSVSAPFSIAKKAIAPTVADIDAVDYDGTAKTPAVSVKDGTTDLADTEYTLVYASNTNAGTAVVTVRASANGDYSFQDTSKNFTIRKIAYTGAAVTAAQNVLTNQAQTGVEADLSSGISGINGAAVSAAVIGTNTDGVLTGTPTVSGGKVKFDVASVADAGKTGTIRVTVTSTNYTDFIAVLTITTVDKAAAGVSFAGTVPTAKTYGNADFTVTASAANVGAGTGVWTWTSSDPAVLEVTGTTAAARVKILGAGSATLTARYESGTTLGEATTPAITVDRATVTAAAKNRSIYVNGTVPDLTSPVLGIDYTVTGLVGTDTPGGTVAMSYLNVVPDNTKAGSYQIVISGLTAPNSNYYPIRLTNGTLTISSQPSGGGAGYTLRFNTNGGSAVPAVFKASGTAVDLSAYKPTREGYTFAGWFSDAALTAAVTAVTLTGDTDVYAGWTKNAVNPFTDVPEGAYYRDAVLWAAEKGITTGVTPATFVPLAACTRAQVVAFLWRAMGSPAPRGTGSFSDVSGDRYYAEAVQWAVEQGITKGTTDATFSPNVTITRAQFVTFLWRAAGSPAPKGISPFTDVAAPSVYYYSAVLWAAEQGITLGTTAVTFSPNAACSRGQIVAFLYRWLGK